MDVLIIGGGAVGMACALEAQRAGASVIVVDAPGQMPPASWGNAGHIAVEQVAPLASWSMVAGAPGRLSRWSGGLSLPLSQIGTWLPFSLRLLRATARLSAGTAAMRTLLSAAMPAWQRHVAALGAPELLRQNGHLIAWMTADAAARGRAHWLTADAGTASFRDADAADMQAVSILTGRAAAGAVRCDGSGQITDLSALAAASRAAFEVKGGRIRNALASALCRQGGRPGAVLADGTRLFADQIVIAAGVGSAALLAPLGHRVPLIAERGYHVEYDPRDWPADLPPLVFEEHALIVTRFAGAVRACSYLEFARPEAPADPRKWARIDRSVRALGLPLTRRTGQWMGARPTLPDYLPAIGRIDDGLVYAFGHQHLGLTLAPLTGEIVGALLAGKAPPMALEPFGLERFRR